MTVLVVLSGLPGVGKTTIARGLARALDAAHVRVDSIEQALRESGAAPAEMNDAGYRVAYRLAEDNLRFGHSVIADSVNPWPLTRDAWAAVGRTARAETVEIEIVCSDRGEHRRRVESRTGDIPGHVLPTWQEVVERDYRPWTRPCLVHDTAGLDAAESVRLLAAEVRRATAPADAASC